MGAVGMFGSNLDRIAKEQSRQPRWRLKTATLNIPARDRSLGRDTPSIACSTRWIRKVASASADPRDADHDGAAQGCQRESRAYWTSATTPAASARSGCGGAPRGPPPRAAQISRIAPDGWRHGYQVRSGRLGTPSARCRAVDQPVLARPVRRSSGAGARVVALARHTSATVDEQRDPAPDSPANPSPQTSSRSSVIPLPRPPEWLFVQAGTLTAPIKLRETADIAILMPDCDRCSSRHR
jgi:hypothetical protein